jgi:hypothetical protein
VNIADTDGPGTDPGTMTQTEGVHLLPVIAAVSLPSSPQR